MKNYFNFANENVDVDPYNEEDWEDKKNFLLKAIEQNNKIVFVASSVKDEDEARLKMKKNTGVVDEYGDLAFEEVSLGDIRNIYNDKRRRIRILYDEVNTIEEEILSLAEGLNLREH